VQKLTGQPLLECALGVAREQPRTVRRKIALLNVMAEGYHHLALTRARSAELAPLPDRWASELSAPREHASWQAYHNLWQDDTANLRRAIADGLQDSREARPHCPAALHPTDEEAEEEEGEEADNEAASCESCETSMCSTHPPTPDSDPNTDPDNDSDAELSDSCSASSRRCDGAEALQQQQRTQALARATPAIGMAKDRPRSSRGKPKKSQWSATQKLKHSDACRHKERLTLGDKVEIIYLHQEAPVSQRKTQVRGTCSCRHVLTHCQ